MDMIIISVGGTLIMVLLSVVSFFLVRLVNQLDKLDDQLTELERKLALYAQTVDYLQKQLEKLQAKYDELLNKYTVLQRGVEAFDEWLNRNK
ncbi:hypothetical protein [Pontibacter mangrovi]|uniref:Uncharacterized protein n=1 Tax=Pontibacter mangrovi TaxID=2589816 RepID=A0A501WA28_9BACT|nr:hypothetical protein [Pontibacter mangrovi]TPE44924.1 hypothetical protein FJM65_07880 [Pontibacter mangrovi]